MESRRIGLSPMQSELVQDFQKRLKEMYGNLFVALYCYGSVARGTAHEKSDLDLLVVLKEIQNRWQERKKIRQVAYEVSFGSGRDIVLSTLVVSESELIYRQDPLMCRIREEGKRAA